MSHCKSVLSCLEPGADALHDVQRIPPARSTAERAFRSLYLTHFDDVMRFVLRFGIENPDSEDLVQRVFVVALRQLETRQPLQQPEAWLRAVALNLVHEYFRWWRVRRAARWLTEQTWAGRARDDTDPERDVLANESMRRVRDVLFQMSRKLRDALVLLDIDGMSPTEAAQLLGIPRNTMRSRHALARAEFRRLWDRSGPRKDLTHD
jgi:RNA polymerase sigma-70 factor, ECF subfamily